MVSLEPADRLSPADRKLADDLAAELMVLIGGRSIEEALAVIRAVNYGWRVAEAPAEPSTVH